MGLLRELGYTNVREYRGGISDWLEHGGLVGRSPAASPRPLAHPGRRAGDRVLDWVGRTSVGAFLAIWLAMVVGSGVVYWLASVLGFFILAEDRAPIAANLRGLATCLYFSFVTATSVGYGDVIPLGAARLLAVAESAAGLLLFGVIVSKFVSRRQDQLIDEIHLSAFEDRLGRVGTNLHLVLSELQALGGACGREDISAGRVAPRLESAAMVFTGELRTIHGLLYQPRREPDEDVLAGLLVTLSAALSEISDLARRMRAAQALTPRFAASLTTIARLAGEICGDCVPRSYAPELRPLMDRVQELARELAAA